MAQTLLRVRVHPHARANRVVGFAGGVLRLQVKAPPERGKANAAVVELLAGRLALPRGDIQIVRGATSPRKVVRIPLAHEEAMRRLGLPEAG